MWRLIRRHTGDGQRDEQGAVIVLMVGFTVALVGMAAFVIDVGSILDEKAQLQNGADAAAMAVAHSCALGSCDTNLGSAGLAGSFANKNARDKASTVTSITVNGKDITVKTRTNAAGSSILPYSFGQILTGVKGKQVNASATARWAPLGRAIVLRLAISACDVSRLGISTVESTILFHSSSSSCDGNSGHDASGAFGWLDDDRPPSGSTCELTVIAGSTASAKTGTSGPTQCLDPYFPIDILVPVFDDVRGVVGTGTNATYLIMGFARFHLTGYRFGSDKSLPTAPCNAPNDCIRGYFVRYVNTAEFTSYGVGADFGASTIQLVS